MKLISEPDSRRLARRGRRNGRSRPMIHGRRVNLRLSGSRLVGGRLQEGHRHRSELSVDRFGRRDQANSGQDRDVRRERHAPDGRGDVAKTDFVQFPVINGADVPVINLPGIKPGDLTLDGPTLADIYLGKITKWNDPEIVKLNPKLKLPATAIVVVHRSDGSGTTFIWTDYLSKVSPEWKDKVGESTAVEWPVGIGAKGNEGVANNTANTAGAIGYVEYAYAKQNKMTYAKMVNAAGKTVAPDSDTFQAAASGAQWGSAKDFYVILTNAPGDKAWPIAGSTFILMYAKPQDAAASSEALKFFAWGYKNGKKMAADLDYVPMPDNVVVADREDLGGPDQGRRREAAFRVEIGSRRRGKAPVRRLSLLGAANQVRRLVRRRKGRLSWLSRDRRESLDAIRREASRGRRCVAKQRRFERDDFRLGPRCSIGCG